MTTERPQLQYKVSVFPSSAHIYVGVPCPDGDFPAELIVPHGHFLTETLRSSWGAIDKANKLRYRICCVDVLDPRVLDRAIAEKLESIKTEWQQLLDQTAFQAHIAKLTVPHWTPLL